MDSERIVREVVENDPRFSDHKDIKLANSSLGELGQILDSVFNPLKNTPLLMKIVSDFLKCNPERIIRTSKSFSPYRSPLVRYALTKMEGYKFHILKMKDDSGEKIIDGGEKDLEVIKTGPETSIKIPVSFNYGIVNRKGGRLCIQTHSSWDGLNLIIYYDADDKSAESTVDSFLFDLDRTVDELNYYKRARINPKGEFLSISKKTWKDIELPDSIKSQIKNNIINIVAKEEIYEKNGISSKRGLLFAGRPGTGKTLVCKILASELKEFTFIWVTANDLHSAESVEGVYEMARELSPTIVLIEDADLFCTDRNAGASRYWERYYPNWMVW